MGWAKYTEDNFEIMQERQNLMKEQRPIIKVYPSVIKPAAEPVRKQSVEYENRYLTCVGCGKIILFSPRDQIFFAEKGWNKPKRCKSPVTVNLPPHCPVHSAYVKITPTIPGKCMRVP